MGLFSKNKTALSQYYLDGNYGRDLGSGVGQENMTPNHYLGFQLGMGANPPVLDVSTPCVFTPAVIVVTSVPEMYMVEGKPTAMAWLIKNLLESHAKAVSGIDFGYTLGTDTGALVGHDSQQFAVPTKTTRAAVNPSFTFTELSGNLIWNCFKRWIWDIQHPDTNASMAQVQFPGAWTMSAYACSFMAIQFDPTMRPERIIDAAHYCNVFPTETGTIGFERTIGTVKPLERSINFTGIVQHNDYTKMLGIEIAKQLQLHVHNYDKAPSHKSGIMPEIYGTGIYGDMLAESETMFYNTPKKQKSELLDNNGFQRVNQREYEKPNFQSNHTDAYNDDRRRPGTSYTDKRGGVSGKDLI